MSDNINLARNKAALIELLLGMEAYGPDAATDLLTLLNAGPDGAVWGSITGTLANQTDLQAALDAKAATADLSSYVTTVSLTTTLGDYISDSDLTTALGSYATTASLASYAPLASPTFTGTPAAPTAAGGTNTTQIATTAFVVSEIASLIASAPGALDTLDELAAALGDDADFAGTVTTALAGKEPSIAAGATGQYWRGDKSWQTLSSAALSDAADLYKSGGPDVAVADGGTGASTAAGARTNLAAAGQSQTGEQISGFIASPSDKSYTIALKMAHAGTITETTTISASGTCTATWKINTTALGGTANSVSSTETTQSHSSSNAFSAGDDIVLTVSSNSSCADMSFTIKYTRTLA